ncbi:hypothetical protein [Sphingosinicella sp. BN140058]|uniref:hypothetical protein n=1 Tax=Sphingosinicella sp. BN140058 TaxID=1892855 RepID=UPI0010132CD6|nr:hypothetical protein [Sphingosinicella sp. BN140058]QAY80215.1 hypothetical protein ETR14_26595 [Sphingosinicella sp. BN140058]
MIDTSAVATTAKEIAAKKKALENAVAQVQSATDIKSALGKVGPITGQGSISIGKLPGLDAPKVSFSEAANQLSGSLQQHPDTQDGYEAKEADDRLRQRAAAGDAFGVAQAMKAQVEAGTILAAKHLACMSRPPIAKGEDAGVRESLYHRAQISSLVTKAMIDLQTLQSYRSNLHAMDALAATDASGPAPLQRTEASEVQPAADAAGLKANIDFGKLVNAATKLVALKQALGVMQSLRSGQKSVRDTQAMYQQMVQAKATSQAAVASLATQEARRKGVSAASLMQAANMVMQANDRTTWDDPSKKKITEAAAKAAERRLDAMVNGDVSDGWSKLLQQRAEAFKQEAFFAGFNNDAVGIEASTVQAISDFDEALGVKASDPAALQAAITAATTEVNQLKASLDGASPLLRAQRDRFLASTFSSQ